MTLALLLSAMIVAASPEIIVGQGKEIPSEFRPCIDYVGAGSLKFVGYTPIDDPDDLLGHSIYKFRFEERAPVYGQWHWPEQDLTIAGHALRQESRSHQIVFVADAGKGGGRRWVGSAWVWRDRAGRPFTPVLGWPEKGERSFDWMPDSARRFAKPVSYDWPQPFWPDLRLSSDDDDPGLVETRKGQTRVLRGIYLTDLPEIMREAKAETCWR